MTNEEEENEVRLLGTLIGYGRMMQLSEQIWRKVLETEWNAPGGEHTVGPCAALLVKCPHPETEVPLAGNCDWCCGSGRVTKRVLLAMPEPDADSHMRTAPERKT